jgi:hypothetical protein
MVDKIDGASESRMTEHDLGDRTSCVHHRSFS